MGSRIIGTITSKEGVTYFVRYDKDDHLLQIGTSHLGPWFIILDNYYLDDSALVIAQDYVDNSTIDN